MYSVVGDWEVVMLELYHEQGDSWNPAPGNKLHDREAQLSRKVQESKEDYEAAVQYVNLLQQDVFTSQLPGVTYMYMYICRQTVHGLLCFHWFVFSIICYFYIHIQYACLGTG